MTRRWLFAFFLLSGFCSLVLEVVWLRLAMAKFGVTTALTSIVLSVFMGGLAVGSWAAGRVARRLSRGPAAVPLRLYAGAEVLVALGATSVPALLEGGRSSLAASAVGAGWGSGAYHAWAGLVVAAAMLPFCAAMGATYPLATAVLDRVQDPGRVRSFSYLYLANTVGATAGTLVSAFALIELLGFRGTLSLVAFLDASLGVAALALSLTPALAASGAELPDPTAGPTPAPPAELERGALAALFLTGLTSMGMEVVWLRQLTPYLGNVVYTFAIVLGGYLTATFLGALLYRRWSSRGGDAGVPALAPVLWAVVAVAAMLPVAGADPRLPVGSGFGAGAVRALLGLFAFCFSLGFMTPFLTDRWSRGEPRRVGSAYALNVLGCILGPLVAGFALLPGLGEKGALVALSAPLVLLGTAGALRSPRRRRAGFAWSALAAAALVVALLAGRTFESLVPGAVVRCDSTATVAAVGRGMERRILVNGIGMTYLTPITKMMAHLPLAFRDRPAERALVVCFGMGTSYRSSLSWGIPTTAVELVPSVPALFPEFHADAAAILASPLGRIVVDDGRRFLERTTESYGVIVIDPPPPLSAAGSSLLYSREFCQALRRRLAPGGIVAQWIPGGDDEVVAAIVRALAESFPHVRVFVSFEGWGLHVLASEEPIPVVPGAVLASRLPERAVADLLEWSPDATAEGRFERVVAQEVPVGTLLRPWVAALTDDRPINEYYFLRKTLGR